MASNDVLLVLSGAGRDEQWEIDLFQRIPGRLQVRWENIRNPDGSLRKLEEVDRSIFEDVTILFTYEPVPAEWIPKVRFVQLSSAGSDLWAKHSKFLDSSVKFATTTGSAAPQIAEWVIGAWIKSQHLFSAYEQCQKDCSWQPSLARQVEDSVGLRVGILGYGAIGRQVGSLCRALGMEVYAFTANERPTIESRAHRGFNIPGLGDKGGEIPSKWFHGKTKEAVNDFLSQGFDLLLISLPLTKLSEKLIGAEQFEILSKRRTFVVNVARGPIVDQDALIQALETGLIRGAALDVTDPEPLPAEHPLWKANNCMITPHVSWLSTHQIGRVKGILADNLVRLYKDEKLMNELSFESRTHHE
ncbi:D-isomer specific 2-hydroxyacid dehydrogenase [Diaporthe helianthi]|uniref:D-isomer specific 2-hydroxyacid dehydrogenase n=1 Tax=Diaporthe helianthi TaxID=158607 RepID=A0A2P5I8H8_DIAHE|nr:D-isomer specific 2-hydroxyacid dehydrogenase [Diaporthe helianthi]